MSSQHEIDIAHSEAIIHELIRRAEDDQHAAALVYDRDAMAEASDRIEDLSTNGLAPYRKLVAY